MAQWVKNLPAMQETQVLSLGWEDALEEEDGNPFQYSCLKNLIDRGAWWATIHGDRRVRHNLVTEYAGTLFNTRDLGIFGFLCPLGGERERSWNQFSHRCCEKKGNSYMSSALHHQYGNGFQTQGNK